jgi:N-acetylmuramoyl-L-alanine amidase
MDRTRCVAGVSLTIYWLSILSLLPVFSFPKTRWDSEGAALAYREARQMKSEIDQSKQASLEMYLKCARTFRTVHIKDPHYGRTGNSIYEEGLVYQEIGDKFSSPDYYKTAVRRFRLLISSYSGNQYCREALIRLISIYSLNLKDEIAAQEIGQILKTRYKYSNAVIQRKPAQITDKASNPPPTGPGSPGKKQSATMASVQNIRFWSTGEYTRVSIDMDSEAQYEEIHLSKPGRIYLDISNALLNKELLNKTFNVGDELLNQFRIGQNKANVVRVVMDLSDNGTYSVYNLYNPYRIIVDLRSSKVVDISRKESPPTAVVPAINSIQSPAGDQISGKTVEAIKVSDEKKPSVQSSDKISSIKDHILQTANTSTSVKTHFSLDALREKPDQPVRSEKNTKLLTTDIEKHEVSKTVTAKLEVLLPNSSELKGNNVSTSAIDAKSELSNYTTGSVTSTHKRVTEKETKLFNAGLNTTNEISIPKPVAQTSHGDRTLTRMLGLKIGRIVLDPGHGGHDFGAIGPGGMLEKNLVLSLALKLKKIIEDKLSAEVILTRTDDAFLSLEERNEIANKCKADLFVSIHANYSSKRSVSGVETYYLDFAKTDAEREIAARENATSVSNVSDLENLIKKIAQADKSAESRELASIIQQKLYSGSRRISGSTQNRGVKSAPFIVLIGANMPSVLAEVAFISNPKDERLLTKKGNKDNLTRALFAGIETYINTLGSDVVHNQADIQTK